MKEAVFPFARFPGVDPMLGPEMRSTGEVMGLDANFDAAFAKSQIAVGHQCCRPRARVHLGQERRQGRAWSRSARDLIELGFTIVATGGTARLPDRRTGSRVERVNKVAEGRPHIVDAMKNGEVQLVFNTTEGAQSYRDSFSIRRTALDAEYPLLHDGFRRPGRDSGHSSLENRGASRRSGRFRPMLDDSAGQGTPFPSSDGPETTPNGKSSNDRRGLCKPSTQN